jgi:two-component system sensor histidine kinase YesM
MNKKHYLKYKLVCFLLFITILPVLLISFFLLSKSINIISKDLKNSSLNSVLYVEQNIDQVIKSVDTTSAVLLSDIYFRYAISKNINTTSKYDNYKNSKLIQQTLSSLKYSNEMISSIYLFDNTNNRGFSSEISGYIPTQSLNTHGWLEWLDNSNDKPDWSLLKNTIITEHKKNMYFLSSKKNIVSKDNIYATFYINIALDFLYERLNKMHIPEYANLWILNPNNDVILCTDSEETFDFSFLFNNSNENNNTLIHTINNTKYFISYDVSTQTGWKYIFTAPKNKAYKNINNLSITIIIVSIFSIFIVLSFAIHLYKIIYNPIENLTYAMNKNKKGEIFLCPPNNKQNEFSILIDNFNSMVIKVDKLNQKLLQQEISTKNAQIKLLQSQINPHFLYNTLDTINWIAKINNVTEISRMTISMSKYYRLSLKEGKEIVLVSEAIELAKAYLDIQQIRFQDNLDVYIDIDDNVLNCLILKRLFQPIIENAVNHGIAKKGSNGLIIISGIDMGKTIKFIIEDNGIGMNQKNLEMLNSSITDLDFDKSGNFALKNLNTQIKLFYGDDYGISITSEYQKGTTVTIEIPKIF